MLAELDSYINIIIVIGAFPILFLIHDIEEILTVERFMHKNSEKISSFLPQRLRILFQSQFSMTSRQFAVAVSFIFIFGLLGTVSGVEAAKRNESSTWFIALNLVFFVHVFTHLGQTIIIRGYTPGVVSAVMIAMPYSMYVFHRLFIIRLVSLPLIYSIAPLGLLIIPIVLIAHKLGTKLVH